MPQFRYRAVTPTGEFVAGEVEAPSRQEVLQRIEYLGHMAIEAEVASPGMLAGGGGLFAPTAKAREVTAFFRELAMLLHARVTLEAALQTLGDDAAKGLARFAGALRASIAAGESFADALERHPAIIEPAYVAMVRAGEASGNLDLVLQAIVEDRARRQLLAERIGSAVRYPCFLIGSATLILVFFLIYVVPQFEPVFKDLGARLNAGAAFVVATSIWLRGNLDLVLGACIVLILATWLVLKQPAVRAILMAALSRLPGISGLLGDRRAARLLGTLGLLVENGVALPTALKIIRDIVTEPRHAVAAQRVHEQVRNGRRFADALAETDLLPPLAVRMLRVGDEIGDLASIARHAAQFYEHKLGIGLDRLMGAVGPITIILVSIVIGGLIVSIMSALLSITDLAT
ncbi:MAG TPA: type II secretion system F family protein [Xanthobacteraceae bacterium]|jgi:general secretion pathway protein F